MSIKSLKSVSVLAAAIALTGCASSYNTAQLSELPIKTTVQASEPFTVGAGDVLEIRVWRSPELSVTSPVRSDGFIAVPLVGSLEVAGLTPEEIKAEVEAQLAEYVASPEATVIVTNVNSTAFSNRVRVTGAVDEPLSITWREDMTVLDLVLMAGGANDFADPQKTVLYRETNDGVQAFPVMLDDILKRGQLNTNYELQPADILTIPESRF